MAATTGDSRWEERYHHFEPQLDAAIKKTIKIGASSSNIKAATKTGAANIKLGEKAVVNICESFWVAKTEAANWTRTTMVGE